MRDLGGLICLTVLCIVIEMNGCETLLLFVLLLYIYLLLYKINTIITLYNNYCSFTILSCKDDTKYNKRNVRKVTKTSRFSFLNVAITCLSSSNLRRRKSSLNVWSIFFRIICNCVKSSGWSSWASAYSSKKLASTRTGLGASSKPSILRY